MRFQSSREEFKQKSGKRNHSPDHLGWVVVPWLTFAAFTLLLVQCSPVAPSMSKISAPKSESPITAERVELPSIQLMIRLPIKNAAAMVVNASASPTPAIPPVEKKVLALTEDELVAFKKEGKLILTLPEDAVASSMQMALIKLDLGKVELTSEDAISTDFALVKETNDWVIKIADTVSAELSQRIRDKLTGLSIMYQTDAVASPTARP